jgi:transglutaminase-like putative cysteine protease
LFPAVLTENAHSIVREQNTTVHLLSQREMKVSKRRVVTVLDKHGNSQVDAYLHYNNSIKIKKIYALVYDLVGNEIAKIKEKDFRDVSAVPGGTLYSESRVKYLEYTPVQFPYTVEFVYEFTTANTGVIPSWYLQNNYNESVEKTEYAVHFSEPGLCPEFREFNLEGIEVSTQKSTNSVSFTATGLKPIARESLSPSFEKLVPHIKTRMVNFHYEGVDGRAEDWNSLGKWITDNLLDGQGELPEATRARARDLVKGIKDPLEKARIIYEFVQQNTRYISVQIGIGGVKPISASVVDKVKYGDCKGLSNYTKALLEVAGVPAYYCHVEAGRDKTGFLADFADLGQGNHVILAIPDGEGLQWIDCTSTTLPFGFLGDFTDDREVLMVTPEGGRLVRTPAYLNESNYQLTEANLLVTAQGAIKGTVAISTRGIQYDNHLGLGAKTKDDQIAYYREYWPYINNLMLPSVTTNHDKGAIRFNEQVEIDALAYAALNGNLMLLAPNVLNRSLYVPDRYRNRELPFEVSRGFLDEDNFTLKLPAGFRLESMKQEKAIVSEFGEYVFKMEYDKEKHQLAYTRKFLVKAGSYPSEKFDEYREFRKSVTAADNGQIVLVKNSL